MNLPQPLESISVVQLLGWAGSHREMSDADIRSFQMLLEQRLDDAHSMGFSLASTIEVNIRNMRDTLAHRAAQPRGIQ